MPLLEFGMVSCNLRGPGLPSISHSVAIEMRALGSILKHPENMSWSNSASFDDSLVFANAIALLKIAEVSIQLITFSVDLKSVSLRQFCGGTLTV